MAPLEQRTVPAKVCKRCGLTKSASEFYRNKLMSDGLYSHCKVSSCAHTPLWHPLPCQLHVYLRAALLGVGICQTVLRVGSHADQDNDLSKWVVKYK